MTTPPKKERFLIIIIDNASLSLGWRGNQSLFFTESHPERGCSECDWTHCCQRETQEKRDAENAKLLHVAEILDNLLIESPAQLDDAMMIGRGPLKEVLLHSSHLNAIIKRRIDARAHERMMEVSERDHEVIFRTFVC